MAEALREPAATPSRAHTALAWVKLAWFAVMFGLLAWALMLRVLQCGSHRHLGFLLEHVCSFRGLGSLAFAVDVALMAALIWHAAQYDPLKPLMPLDEGPSARRPRALFMASVRALRRGSTPHRLKHRFSFWLLLMLLLAFGYTVLFSPFLFW